MHAWTTLDWECTFRAQTRCVDRPRPSQQRADGSGAVLLSVSSATQKRLCIPHPLFTLYLAAVTSAALLPGAFFCTLRYLPPFLSLLLPATFLPLLFTTPYFVFKIIKERKK
jgi:hypothetical protein